MYRIVNKNIFLNRGEPLTIHLVNKSDNFRAGDILTFYICKKGNYQDILFSKDFEIEENTDTIDMKLTEEETKLGDPIKVGYITYWYTIKLNGGTVLVGSETKGEKLFVLYPSPEEGGSN